MDDLAPDARAASSSGSRGSTGPSSNGRPSRSAPGTSGPRRSSRSTSVRARHDELTAAGEDAYRRGAVAILVVAGGEGTRLGFDGPKGVFPSASALHKSIYQLQAEKVLSLSRRVGREVPLLVLTSPKTDEETRAFFRARDDFGLADGQLSFFAQGTVPSLDQRRPRAPRRARRPAREPRRARRRLRGARRERRARPPERAGRRAARLRAGRQRPRARRRSGARRPRARGAYGRGDEGAREDASRRARRAPRDRRLARSRDRVHRADARADARAHGRRRADLPLGLAGDARVERRLPLPPGRRATACRCTEARSRSARGSTARCARSRGGSSSASSSTSSGRSGASASRSIARREFAPVKNAAARTARSTAVELAHRLRRMARSRGCGVDLPPGELIEISPLLAATREQFLALWDGRVTLLKRGRISMT